ncbi:hypothetical protein NLO74_18055 [Pseudomonas tremae]|uniref:Uncharacterized protein n=1 Tax=Pseudomonas coronafaciens pv. porri TaxID=83964 RepID=A0ABR5JIW5_9PSED|nr:MULTISPECIES: hypothetical protein [Pseudomonas syringae group]KOP52640.1 hypothetical protein OX90_23835 [Pseudomonas coronafaciens pv. porri]MCF5805585.1 hypothetical protein [Pseudomonas tremae]MCQ3027903.1 hypothetical protein [Pseudomonas tremae]
MKMLLKKYRFFLAYITISTGLLTASDWWEKGLAENLGDPVISPNGCYRVEAFKPFWILPDIFHPEPDVNEINAPKWFPWWGYPAFFKLYDNRNGQLISETTIYDLEVAGGEITWGSGSKTVFIGMIPVGPNTPDCIGDQPDVSGYDR